MPTPISQFRLGPLTLTDLQIIAEHLTETTGRKSSTADAIRHAARVMVAKIERKKNESTKTNQR